MKRSPMAPRKTPMARTSIRPKAPIARAGLLRTAAVQREARTRKPMKKGRPQMTPIRRAARNQECTLQLVGVCNRDSSTVVLCHSNRLEDGKGMGFKAPDTAGCFGCSSCHDVLDGRAPRPPGMTVGALDARFDIAVGKTHEILRTRGLMP